jgi:hypothetical protein
MEGRESFIPILMKTKWSSFFFRSFANHFQIELNILGSDSTLRFVRVDDLEFFLLKGVLIQNFNAMELIKVLEKIKEFTFNVKRSH